MEFKIGQLNFDTGIVPVRRSLGGGYFLGPGSKGIKKYEMNIQKSSKLVNIKLPHFDTGIVPVRRSLGGGYFLGPGSNGNVELKSMK